MDTAPRKTLNRIHALVVAIVLAGLALVASAAHGTATSPAALPTLTSDEAIKLVTGADGVLRFDVAENGGLFAWSGQPELKDGLPITRASFISQGYIYPAGTLTEGNGVRADGSPEFPDKVLGQWTCWGWNVGAGAAEGAATWVVSHLLGFGDAPGEATLISEGYSIDALGVVLARAVTGGTGPYAGATGVQTETNLGYNASNGMNFHYEVRLTGA